MLKLAFLATMVLVVLKALGLIPWAWFLVFVPLMIWLAYTVVMTIVGLITAALGLLAVYWADKKGLLK